jgi:hypothetical protein
MLLNFQISATPAPSQKDSPLMVHEALNIDNKIPGPGNYKELSNLSNVGKYVVSSHIGGTKAIFDHEKRVTRFDHAKSQAAEKPGPGYYRMPS